MILWKHQLLFWFFLVQILLCVEAISLPFFRKQVFQVKEGHDTITFSIKASLYNPESDYKECNEINTLVFSTGQIPVIRCRINPLSSILYGKLPRSTLLYDEWRKGDSMNFSTLPNVKLGLDIVNILNFVWNNGYYFVGSLRDCIVPTVDNGNVRGAFLLYPFCIKPSIDKKSKISGFQWYKSKMHPTIIELMDIVERGWFTGFDGKHNLEAIDYAKKMKKMQLDINTVESFIDSTLNLVEIVGIKYKKLNEFLGYNDMPESPFIVYQEMNDPIYKLLIGMFKTTVNTNVESITNFNHTIAYPFLDDDRCSNIISFASENLAALLGKGIFFFKTKFKKSIRMPRLTNIKITKFAILQSLQQCNQAINEYQFISEITCDIYTECVMVVYKKDEYLFVSDKTESLGVKVLKPFLNHYVTAIFGFDLKSRYFTDQVQLIETTLGSNELKRCFYFSECENFHNMNITYIKDKSCKSVFVFDNVQNFVYKKYLDICNSYLLEDESPGSFVIPIKRSDSYLPINDIFNQYNISFYSIRLYQWEKYSVFYGFHPDIKYISNINLRNSLDITFGRFAKYLEIYLQYKSVFHLVPFYSNNSFKILGATKNKDGIVLVLSDNDQLLEEIYFFNDESFPICRLIELMALKKRNEFSSSQFWCNYESLDILFKSSLLDISLENISLSKAIEGFNGIANSYNAFFTRINDFISQITFQNDNIHSNLMIGYYEPSSERFISMFGAYSLCKQLDYNISMSFSPEHGDIIRATTNIPVLYSISNLPLDELKRTIIKFLDLVNLAIKMGFHVIPLKEKNLIHLIERKILDRDNYVPKRFTKTIDYAWVRYNFVILKSIIEAILSIDAQFLSFTDIDNLLYHYDIIESELTIEGIIFAIENLKSGTNLSRLFYDLISISQSKLENQNMHHKIRMYIEDDFGSTINGLRSITSSLKADQIKYHIDWFIRRGEVLINVHDDFKSHLNNAIDINNKLSNIVAYARFRHYFESEGFLLVPCSDHLLMMDKTLFLKSLIVDKGICKRHELKEILIDSFNLDENIVSSDNIETEILNRIIFQDTIFYNNLPSDTLGDSIKKELKQSSIILSQKELQPYLADRKLFALSILDKYVISNKSHIVFNPEYIVPSNLLGFYICKDYLEVLNPTSEFALLSREMDFQLGLYPAINEYNGRYVFKIYRQHAGLANLDLSWNNRRNPKNLLMQMKTYTQLLLFISDVGFKVKPIVNFNNLSMLLISDIAEDIDINDVIFNDDIEEPYLSSVFKSVYRNYEVLSSQHYDHKNNNDGISLFKNLYSNLMHLGRNMEELKENEINNILNDYGQKDYNYRNMTYFDILQGLDEVINQRVFEHENEELCTTPTNLSPFGVLIFNIIFKYNVDMCVICLDDLTFSHCTTTLATQCGHLFHNKCLDHYTVKYKNKRCPTCRNQL